MTDVLLAVIRLVDFALWSVDDTDLPRRLTRSVPDSETKLETWIEQRPELIRDGLVPVARQLIFPTRERLDLLCIESQSRWVIVELKRDRMAREVVAQRSTTSRCCSKWTLQNCASG